MQRYNKCSGTQQWQLIIYHWSTLAIEVERLLFTVVTKRKGGFWWTGFCHTYIKSEVMLNISRFTGQYFSLHFTLSLYLCQRRTFCNFETFSKLFTFRLTALMVVQCWLHCVVTLCWKFEQGKDNGNDNGNGNGSVHLYKWPVNVHSD